MPMPKQSEILDGLQEVQRLIYQSHERFMSLDHDISALTPEDVVLRLVELGQELSVVIDSCVLIASAYIPREES